MEDVMQRVINNLRSTEPPEDEEETEKDQVLVAYDLTLPTRPPWMPA